MSGASGTGPNFAAQNIVLIGYRGCGKTLAGRALASALGWACVDTDDRIAATAGRTIRAIFEQDGEPAFRALETQVIAEIVRGTRQVIAVGGGAVLSAVNLAALRSAGACVWLTAPPEELHRRIQADSGSRVNRPALTGYDSLDEVRRLLTQREPLYAATAHHVVATAGQTPEQVMAAVLSAVTGGGPAADTP